LSSWEYQNPVRKNVLVVRPPSIVRIKGYLLIVKDPKSGEEEKVPLVTLNAVILHGKSIALTVGVIDKLIEQRIPVLVVTRDNIGFIDSPMTSATPNVRWAQYYYLNDPARRLILARGFVWSKLKGYASVLRYLARHSAGVEHQQVLRGSADEIEDLLGGLDRLSSVGEVLRLEAQGSKAAWSALRQTLLREYEALGFTGRNPRGQDPVNQSVNYLHAILYNLAFRALVSAGLDPHLGALHSEGPGRKPLVYDFSEQFKPIALRALAHAAKTARLRVHRNGLLTRRTINTITSRLQKLLHTGNPTPASENYRAAWRLRRSMLENTIFKPYTYTAR